MTSLKGNKNRTKFIKAFAMNNRKHISVIAIATGKKRRLDK